MHMCVRTEVDSTIIHIIYSVVKIVKNFNIFAHFLYIFPNNRKLIPFGG